MKRTRGEGGLFRVKGSANWYIKVSGKRIATGTPTKAVATAKLKAWQGRASLGIKEANAALCYEDIREGLLARYRIGKQKDHSLVKKADGTETVWGLDHLDRFFAGMKTANITPALLSRFTKQRLDTGAAPGTVNRNLGLLRRMFHQAHRENASVSVPYFPMLEEAEARQGFVEDAAFMRLLEALPERLRAFVLLLYTSGVRSGEAKKIQWEHVDLDAREIRLPGSITKNGKPRTLPLVDMVVERLQAEHKESGAVFPVGNFIKAWWSACAKAGLGTRVRGKANGNYGTYEGLIPHDLRRSALRNMIRAGVSTTVAKKISGHVTDSIFQRYDITSTKDLHAAANRIQAGLQVLGNGSSLGQALAVTATRKTLKP